MRRNYLDIIEDHLGASDVASLTRVLHSAYQPFMLDGQVWDIIQKVFPDEVFNSISHFKAEIVGHKFVNDLVIKHYPGECTIKYHFIKNFINRHNEVSTFEMNVGNSRLDIGRINGYSYAYEIKTELDSLEKLDKQLHDYQCVFDYIHVVIHNKHLDKVTEIAPNYCGIISFRHDDKQNRWKFYTRRKAVLHQSIKPDKQLNCLTSKEFDIILKKIGINGNSLTRREKEQLILSFLSPEKINHLFKTLIKRRFQKRWEHLEKHFESINPIDLQMFFKTEADPYWVYYKNSSMV